jgi:hypothetical protein
MDGVPDESPDQTCGLPTIHEAKQNLLNECNVAIFHSLSLTEQGRSIYTLCGFPSATDPKSFLSSAATSPSAQATP